MQKGDWAFYIFFCSVRVIEEDKTLVLSPCSLLLARRGLAPEPACSVYNAAAPNSWLTTSKVSVGSIRIDPCDCVSQVNTQQLFFVHYSQTLPTEPSGIMWITVFPYGCTDVAPIDSSCIFLWHSYSSLYKLHYMMGPVVIYLSFYICFHYINNVWQPLFSFLVT